MPKPSDYKHGIVRSGDSKMGQKMPTTAPAPLKSGGLRPTASGKKGV